MQTALTEITEVTEVTEVSFEPFLVSIPKAAEMIGRSTTFIYACIGDGTLEAVKSDARTLVRVPSLRKYAASLPPAKIQPVPIRPPERLRRRRA